MKLADIGVNLADKRFNADLDEVLDRAREAGVACQLITGTSMESSERALALADTYPDLYATAGVHPHQASIVDRDALSQLRNLSSQARVVAIGETGLDFNRDFSPRPQQEKAFAEQLALACEQQLPVFLHQRDAHERFLPILKEQRDRLPGAVVHCFTGTREELFDYLDLDCHIGITGWICDERRGQALQALAHNIPLNRLLLETDSPYLLPRDLPQKPFRSGRNEPVFLPWIAQRVADCYGQPLATIASHSWDNTISLFRLPVS